MACQRCILHVPGNAVRAPPRALTTPSAPAPGPNPNPLPILPPRPGPRGGLKGPWGTPEEEGPRGERPEAAAEAEASVRCSVLGGDWSPPVVAAPVTVPNGPAMAAAAAGPAAPAAPAAVGDLGVSEGKGRKVSLVPGGYCGSRRNP